MQCKLYHLLLLLAGSCFVVNPTRAQTDDPYSAAPQIKTFALNPDQIGAAANSVNLFTGDLALPINLISLPGRNGLGVNVAISYNSNVQQAASTRNLESPTGILGLGWSMDMPKIIVDHKETGAKEDDEYYLVEGGGTNRLVRTKDGADSKGFFYVYETENYQFWKIKFYDQRFSLDPNKYDQRWEIIREDGTTYVYGDKNSGRNTVQWTVRWGNWIGHSEETTGQDRMGSAWNLSEIINQWGERITFRYRNVEQSVGPGGLTHTEASYLESITDALGRRVEFIYKAKELHDPLEGRTDYFYEEPHTEHAEPDGYQETYEKEYLDYIEVYRETGSKLFSVDLSYTILNAYTYAAKPLLTSVVQQNAAGQSLPGLQFEYDLDGPTKGFLQKVTLPTKGTVSYAYQESGNALGHAGRVREIAAPSGYSEPKVWIGDDYVVVLWREMDNGVHVGGRRDTRLYVYQWLGEWKEQYIGYLPGVEAVLEGEGTVNFLYKFHYKDVQATLQKDFFAIMYPTGVGNDCRVYIQYKNKSLSYYKDRERIINHLWSSYSETVDGGYRSGAIGPWLMSGTNYVALGRHNYGSVITYVHQGDTWRKEIISQPTGAYYGTGANNFIINHTDNRASTDQVHFHFLSEHKTWNSRQMSAVFNTDVVSRWFSTNTYGLAIFGGASTGEGLFRWDRYYSNFYHDNTVIGVLDDQAPVFLTSNSSVGISNGDNTVFLRYYGQGWIREAKDASRKAFGDDFVVWNDKSRSRVYIGRYDLRSYSLVEQDLGAVTTDPPKAGINLLGSNGKVYYRWPYGWVISHSLTVPADKTLLMNSVESGKNYVAYSLRDNANSYIVTENVQMVSNGSPVGQPVYIQGAFRVYATWYGGVSKGESLTSYNTIVTANNRREYASATTLWLHRVVGEGVTGQQVDFPVATITSSDGTADAYTSIKYDFATATYDQSGSIAQYHKVTLLPGSSSNTATAYPNGYTENYFYNGLTWDELGPDSGTGQIYIQYVGIPYQTKVFDASGTLVADNKTLFARYSRTLSDMNNKIAMGYFVRPYRTTASVNGVETVTNQEFDLNTGLVSVTRTSTSGSQNASNETRTEYKYFWQHYDPNREKNMLTPVIQTRKTVFNRSNPAPSGIVVGMSATTWKEWNGVFAPHKTYQRWHYGSNADFDFTTASGTGEPANPEWRKVSEIDKLDAKGNVLQVTSF